MVSKVEQAKASTAMKTIRFTAKYKSHKGDRLEKTFKINDYHSARQCLLYVESQSERKELISRLDGILSKEDVLALAQLFAPSYKVKKAAIARASKRKAITASPAYQAAIEKEISRMVSHPGFMSNQPF